MLGDVDEPTAPFGLLDVQGDGSDIDEARHELERGWPAVCASRRAAHGVSVASLCHLAWAQVLARTSGRERCGVRDRSVRPHAGWQGSDRVLGLFINTLPVRIAVGDDGAEAACGRHRSFWRS